MLSDVKEMIMPRHKKSGLIFDKGDNKHLGPVLCLNWLHRACKKAGLRSVGWHTLRHTFASHLAQNGISIVLIKELLGHADIKTTMRYSHLTSSAIKSAVETLSNNFGQHLVTAPKVNEDKINILINSKAEIIGKPQ